MKKLFTLFLFFIIVFSFTVYENQGSQGVSSTTEVNTDTEWVIYWYLCGSDLETNYGAATNDLIEMMDVNLPENVKVIIQTGGASTWQNDIISADKLQRYVYDNKGLTLIEEQPSANMGDPQTLVDFLTFAKNNYPAKRTMVNFWNHGGGSVTGVAFDELYGMNSLTLNEMYKAFISVYKENPDNQPIDIIGFDTCLMATIDTAFTFSDIGKYLVASEELQPGNGWMYSGWLNAIAENSSIEPFELSKVICDTYVKGCELIGTQDNITLSVTNLSKVGKLITAYDDFGKEALISAVKNPAFFAHFSTIANSTENYGGNTREQGFTNMVDLGHLVEKSAELLPETSSNVLSALKECVEYKVNGKYRSNSMGLSCYYSFNGDIDDFNDYTKIGPSEAFKDFYTYGLTGEVSEQCMDYLAEMHHNSLPELITLNSVEWESMPITIDDEGFAVMTLGSKANDILSSVTFELYYVNAEENTMLCLGTNNDLFADWEKGIFKDNFRGMWGGLDGKPCYMELAYDSEDYNRFFVPILLNGEKYNLSVIYDFNIQKFYMEGARKPLDESGAADKNLRCLVEGDKIQTLLYTAPLSDCIDEFTAVPIDTIIVTPETAFTEIDLGDGLFIMKYCMQDSQGNIVYSQPFSFKCLDGKVFVVMK